MYSKAQAATVLPRGRHALSREEVRNSQRARLLAAIVDAVAERGYVGASVAEVIARARVSKSAFYEHFSSKQECFATACEEISGELVGELNRLAAAEEDWIEGLRLGTRAFLAWLADHPAAAQVAFRGIPEAGGDAAAQLDLVLERFQAIFETVAARARREQPDLPPLPDLAGLFVGAGVFHTVGHLVRTGRIDELPQLELALLRLQVGTITDAQRAVGLG